MKNAWINTEAKVISFHKDENTVAYRAEDSKFWEYICFLIRAGYRVQ